MSETSFLFQKLISYKTKGKIKGKSIAKQMYSSNADIILAAGDTGVGSIEVARENNKFAIGVDRDQNYLAQENVITSALKKLNVASYDLVKDLVEGNFKGGEAKVYGIKEDGVGLAESTSKHVPKEVLDYVNTQKEKVLKGEIIVPKNEEEYKGLVK